MATWNQPTGNAGQLQLSITETSTNPGANQSTVRVTAQIYTPAGSWHNDHNLTVSLSGDVSWSRGDWSFDSSGGWHVLYDGYVTKTHASNGTASFGVTFALNSSTGTSGVGGPASVGGTIGLTTLTIPPGTPTGLTATYVSDAQINLAWTSNYASNGVPTSTWVDGAVNGGGWQRYGNLGNTSAMAAAVAANQKLIFRVTQGNAAGGSAWSSSSAPVWTSPAAPTACAAAKQSDGSILVSWTNNVGYSEYGTEVWHGTITGGVTTWDGAPLATAASGASSYSHASPNPALVHVYQVRAKTTSGSVLYSGYAVSNSVQLLTAPNAPTVAAIPQYANKAQALTVNWTHNPVDSTAETAYEVARSTDGGTTWTTTGKTAGTASSFTIPASTYTANTAVTIRVRTWGQATTGGSDGTGGSPWSENRTVTFKTAPTLSITAPTTGGLSSSVLSVSLSFAQAEGAAFVSAAVKLLQGLNVIESVNATSPTAIAFATKLANGATYTVQAVATDSNGLTATAAPVTFSVTYSPPAPATITATYVPEVGMSQVALTFPAPTGSQVAAAQFALTRTIKGVVETIWTQAVSGAVTIVDTTPTIAGMNTYSVITYSSDGAASAPVSVDLATAETRWAFMSTGDGFANVLAFYGNLVPGSNPARDSALVKMAGRSRPVALYGETSTLEVTGTATLVVDEGATPDEVETFLLTAGNVCYRDPSGRRVFGMLTGQIANRNARTADFSFKVAEAD